MKIKSNTYNYDISSDSDAQGQLKVAMLHTPTGFLFLSAYDH